MTDNEIIKALGCCGSENCRGCPYRNGKCHQGNPMIRDALDLIKRQQAEIEHFREVTKMVKSEAITEYEEKLHPYKLHYGNLRMEIAREFADRICEGRVSNDPVVIAVKCTVKEMEKECEPKD